MNLRKEQLKEYERIRNINLFGAKKTCKCGNRNIIFYNSKQNKKICTWCGNYVYRNERDEFKQKLFNLL